MAKNAVLIVTNHDDPHADYLIPIIHAEGGNCFRFNSELFPREIDLSVSIKDGLLAGWIDIGKGRLALDDIVSVWYRRPLDPLPDPSVTLASFRDFVQKESREFLESVWFQVNALWVNHPHMLRRASKKLEQLVVARRVGWEVPSSLISNDIVEITHFIEQNKDVVVKTLACQFSNSEAGYRSFFTHRLRPEDLGAIKDAKLCPCIFQAAIPKALELRITVIGDTVFAAAMDTQRVPQARDDWRRAINQDIPCTQFDLPQEILQKTLAIVKAFGLHFASMDVILTPDGDYVFLDLKPNGQWLWIALRTGMPMARKFAQLLVS